jgi:hypothetical protein
MHCAKSPSPKHLIKRNRVKSPQTSHQDEFYQDMCELADEPLPYVVAAPQVYACGF